MRRRAPVIGTPIPTKNQLSLFAKDWLALCLNILRGKATPQEHLPPTVSR